ncbi:hypothetical protein AX16_007072 [Volvariella volvacea WC 439]|nr:hypothetical protein AX16_007072 [Volvariella volvacea WC 439]
MTEVINSMLSAIAMEDDLGITYVVENAQQFWSELEDILNFAGPDSPPPTLELLDGTFRRSLGLCAFYHEQYLQAPFQLQRACDLILDSELFTFHSTRMCDNLVEDVKKSTNPHEQLIYYHVLLCFGHRNPDFFRQQHRWEPLIQLLKDHVLVDIDSDVEDTYFGANGNSGGGVSAFDVPVPIEAKLRSLAVRLLYEVCLVQKLSINDLKIFEDSFVDYLFELVEQTRQMQDDTFNYSVIKLIVALNEQFMVACLSKEAKDAPQVKNRVLRVLMGRLGSSKTFGENIIFMLNRAQGTPEDLCMQMLILKILYVLFTTNGTSEYFYTNDLKVLVDVFLREITDLDEESDSLRHTFLRVLHPLLTRTQLRNVPYKRAQIVYTLESLIRETSMRDVDPTTKRLVGRCLSGEWCVQFLQPRKDIGTGLESSRKGSPMSDSALGSGKIAVGGNIDPSSSRTPTSPPEQEFGVNSVSASSQLTRTPSIKTKNLKPSKSVEHLKPAREHHNHKLGHHSHPMPPVPRSPLDGDQSARRPSNASSSSLVNVSATASSSTTSTVRPSSRPPPPPPPSSSSHKPRKGSTHSMVVEGSAAEKIHHLTPLNPDPTSHPHPYPHHLHLPSSTDLTTPGHDSNATRPRTTGTNGVNVNVNINASATDGSGVSPTSSVSSFQSEATDPGTSKPRRSAPPIPTKRRKPPAVPVAKARNHVNGGGSMDGGVQVTAMATASGASITTIKSTVYSR